MSSTSRSTSSITLVNQSYPNPTWLRSLKTGWTRSSQVSLTRCTDQFWVSSTNLKPTCFFKAWWHLCMHIDITRTTCFWCRRGRKATSTLPCLEIACITTARKLKTGFLSTPLRLTSLQSLLCQRMVRSSSVTRATCRTRTSRSSLSTQMTSRSNLFNASTGQ